MNYSSKKLTKYSERDAHSGEKTYTSREKATAPLQVAVNKNSRHKPQ